MTPPAALLDEYREDDTVTRPLKKQRTESFVNDDPSDPQLSAAVRRHPLGVRPSGNAFTSEVNLKTSCGSYALLPDEVLALSLEYLEAADLLRLGGTCRALHAFTRSEELWRSLFVE